MKNILIASILFIFPLFSYAQDNVSSEIVDPKGAIIIAQLEGEVFVINNSTGVALPADKVKAGGILFDGHTVKTMENAKVVLLFLSIHGL